MKSAKGFTLIEVLIALVILSISLTAIIKAVSQNIKDTIYLQDKTISHWVGLRVINEARIGLLLLPTPPGSLDKQTEMLGKKWAWHAYYLSSPNPHIKKIQVDVSREGEEANLTTLVSYVYVA